MKSLFLLAVAMIVAVPTASARPRPTTHLRRFEANKTFGLGIMVGEPTGLSAKYYLSADRAIDGGIGGVGYYRNRSGFQAHVYYLWHPASLASTADFELPLYFGIGARVFDFDFNAANDRAFAIGARVPVGVALDFNNIPLDVFFEVAVVVDFLFDYSDNLDADFNAAIGVRYYFE